MSDQEAIKKLDILIKAFADYNKILDGMENNCREKQAWEITPKAA